MRFSTGEKSFNTILGMCQLVSMTQIHHQFSCRAPFPVFGSGHAPDLAENFFKKGLSGSTVFYIVLFAELWSQRSAVHPHIENGCQNFLFLGSPCLLLALPRRHARKSHDPPPDLNQQINGRIIFDQPDDQLTGMFHNAPGYVNQGKA